MIARLMTAIVGMGVALAGVVLWRMAALRRVRWIIAAFTAYGVVALVYATVTGVALREAISGHGLFETLPKVLQGATIGSLIILPLGWVVSMMRAGVPRFREGSLRSKLYQVVALTTCVAIVATSFSHGTGGVAGSAQLSPQERVATLNASLRAIEDGDRDLARDTWDPDYVIDMVGRDPQALFEWVKDNTSWIPYRGTLRGAVGVLMDRQGNSLDRALLLANLLEKMGQTVRLAHGELRREQAVEILSGFTAHKPAIFPPIESSITSNPVPRVDLRPVNAKYQLDNNSIQKTLVERQKQIARAQADLAARVSEQTSRLLTTVSKPDHAQELNQRREAAIATLRDHWWVQREDGQKWVDMDLFAQNDTPLASPDRTTAVSGLPDDLCHEIAVRVMVEQFSGGTRKENAVLEHVLRPSELYGQPIVVQFWPGAWSNDLQADPNGKYGFKATALEQKQWVVFLKVGRDSVAQAIIGTGDAAGDAGATDPFGALGGALSRSLGQQNTAELTAAWIEYEIRVPGEAPRSIRRVVFDLLGPARRKSGSSPQLPFTREQQLSRSLALMMQTEILPISCRISPEFVMHIAVQSLLKNRELVSHIAGDQFTPGSEATRKQLEDASASASPLLLLAVVRSEWSDIADHVFLDRPNILTRHRSLVIASNDLAIQDAVDIVANEVGVDLTQEDAFPIRLEQGVLDTNAEALILGGPATDNTAEAYAASRNWLLINTGQSSSLSSEFSDDLRRRVAEDLDHGYTVVVPQAPIQNQDGVSADWWRIDPHSGDTLGISTNGWGGAEDASLLHMAFVFLKGFTFEYALCQGIAQGINGVRMLNDKYFGAWHPSWTTGIKSRDPAEIFRENHNVCLVQAIIGGFVATLPLLMITMKARQARIAAETARRIAAKEAEAKLLEEYLEKTMGVEGNFEKTIPPKGTTVLRNDPAALLVQEQRFQTLKTRMSKITEELDQSTRETIAYVQGRPGGLLPSPTYDPMVEEAMFNRLRQEEQEFNQIYSDLREIDPKTYRGSVGPDPKPRPLSPPKFGVGNDNETLSGPKQLVGSAGANNALGGGTP